MSLNIELQQFLTEAQQFYATQSAPWTTIIVETEDELQNSIMSPPAIAYVRQVDDFYFLHGPEFWFGQSGTQEFAFQDRELNRWIRAPYSGNRAIIQSTNIDTIKTLAYNRLFTMINAGPNNFTANEFGTNYNTAIQEAYRAYINTCFIDINCGTCETEGEQLYDIADGDVLAEDNSRFVMDCKANSDNPKQFGYPLYKVGVKAITDALIGLQLHHAVQNPPSLMAVHPMRMGYTVTATKAYKGTRTLHLCVYPNSAPRPQFSEDPKIWREVRTPVIEKWKGDESITWERTDFSIYPATVNDPGDWYISNFWFLNLPTAQAPIKVTNFSFLEPASAYPDGIKVSITLAQPCPIPLIMSQLCVCLDDQPYWDEVAPVKNYFGFTPCGVFGGYLNQVTIQGYLSTRSTSGRLNGNLDIVPAGEIVSLYDTVDERWGGTKGHSPLRGMQKGDYVRMPEHDNMYRVTYVNGHQTLENPFSLRFHKDTHLLVPSITNPYGIEIGGHVHWYPNIELDPLVTGYRNNVYFMPSCYWSVPSDDTMGLPLIISRIDGSTLQLVAPIPCDIEAGTRLNIYASQSSDATVYRYMDWHEFSYKLALHNQAKYVLGSDYLTEHVVRLIDLQTKMTTYYEEAKNRAARIWFSPPYKQLKTLRSLLWSSEFDAYGDTYPEILDTIRTRIADLIEFRDTAAPSVSQYEQMSILDYGKV